MNEFTLDSNDLPLCAILMQEPHATLIDLTHSNTREFTWEAMKKLIQIHKLPQQIHHMVVTLRRPSVHVNAMRTGETSITELNAIWQARWMRDNRERLQFFSLQVWDKDKDDSHSNLVVFDVQGQTLFRYEPHGSILDNAIGDLNQVDVTIASWAKQNSINYVSRQYTTPEIGPQVIENRYNQKSAYILDPTGYCAAWSLWYMHLVLTSFTDSIRTENTFQIPLKNEINNALTCIKNNTGLVDKLSDELKVALVYDVVNDIEVRETIPRYLTPEINMRWFIVHYRKVKKPARPKSFEM
jgi:hypothetical protein